jgi:uncharacterized protein (DUF305 family)
MPQKVSRVGIPIGVALCTAAYAAVPVADAAFVDETRTAMDRMMTGMETHATGNADVDFATMMIPHHQGAIDMAMAELRHGHDERLRRIAQEIVVDQQQEITAMEAALQKHGAASSTAKPMKMETMR